MAIKHRNPNYDDRTAVAPYNFVPLPEKALAVDKPLPQDRFSGYSGFFECILETSSPTYVRGMITEKDIQKGREAKNQPTPFSTDGGKTPTIPGSSLRGMIRTLVDIVSFSKPGSISEEQIIYRSVGDTTSHGTKYRKRIMQETNQKNQFIPRLRGGYMREENGNWYIQPAKEIGGTTFARIAKRGIPHNLNSWHGCRNAKEIYIHPGPFEFQKVRGGFLQVKYAKVLRANNRMAHGLQKAALAESGRMFKKNSEAVIFEPDPAKSTTDNWTEVPPEIVKSYRDQITKEQEDLLGKYGVLQPMQPVFYLIEHDKLVYFGHTMMLRLPYRKAASDLMPPELRDKTHLDLTEALFGFVDKENADGKKETLAGRVFFSDASYIPQETPWQTEEIAPKILSTPNPTSFQFYLLQPFPDNKTRLRDYDDDTHLRGYKLYWNKGNHSLNEIAEQDQKKLKKDREKPLEKQQFTRIQPLQPGVKFEFKIYFDNLTKIELGALARVLRWGTEEGLRFKLGMGKPLGMGAIKIHPTLHLLDRTERYGKLFGSDKNWYGGDCALEEGNATETAAIAAFENWIMADREINPGALNNFSELPRIQAMLKMLSWPGPDPELTRYMEIEHPDRTAKRGKRNEYRERPVLPDPFGVGVRTKGKKAPKPQKPVEEPPAVPPTPVSQETKEKKVYSSTNVEMSDEAVSEITRDIVALLAKRAEEREEKAKTRKLSRAERRRQKRKKKK